MAVTSLWPVKTKLSHVINYIQNPEKTVTEGLNELASLHQINGVMEYAANDVKTERRSLVTGINCTEEFAARQFLKTKKMYEKTDSRLCYHGYQSFKADEITAQTAHEIGVKLAERLWGDRFEVLVATHCNTGHYHNHFVLNSVSFKDGKRFINSHEDYRKMRAESDRLCQEYGLSVIGKPKNKSKNYSEWAAEKESCTTLRSTIRADIDRAVSASDTKEGFFLIMKEMGYEIKIWNSKGEPLKYPALKPPDANGFFRFHKLGDEYTLDRIYDRIYMIKRPVLPFPDLGLLNRVSIPPEFKPQKLHGIKAMYISYCFKLHILKEHPTCLKRVSFILRGDIIKMEKFNEQAKFLARTNISDINELKEYLEILEDQIADLKDDRDYLKKEIKTMEHDDDTDNIHYYREQLLDINNRLTELRKEVNICKEIEKRSANVEENLSLIETEQDIERKEYEDNELFRGSSRSGRSDISEQR